MRTEREPECVTRALVVYNMTSLMTKMSRAAKIPGSSNEADDAVNVASKQKIRQAKHPVDAGNVLSFVNSATPVISLIRQQCW